MVLPTMNATAGRDVAMTAHTRSRKRQETNWSWASNREMKFVSQGRLWKKREKKEKRYLQF